MIRQLGFPTWFCSFSAADTKWYDLLSLLGRLVDHKTYTKEEINTMSLQKKSELIQKDPVTCARYFDHLVQLFIYKVLKSSANPIGKIEDYFLRTEFQQRGSPHIHTLFWIKNAWKYGHDSVTDVEAFVDKYVTCDKNSKSQLNAKKLNQEITT